MHRTTLLSCVCFAWVVSCGGTNDTLIGDAGNGDSGQNGDGRPPGDASNDVASILCDAGLVACGGQCIDTSSDPNNCGGCSIVCNTQCNAGICQLLGGCDASVGAVGDNACLTVDATNVYWGSGLTGGAVWKVPVGGGCPALMIGNQALPHGMASDGTNLFYANQGTATVQGSVQRIPINGSAATPIASGQLLPLDVVVDANNVYWTNAGDGSVWKSDKTTPNPIKLAGPNGPGHATHLRVDATNVYFTDHTSGLVYRVPIAGGSAPTAMTTTTQSAGYIAIAAPNAYFGAYPSNVAGIFSIGLSASAGTPAPVVKNLPYINGIETDGTSLWYAVQSNVNPYQAATGEIHRATVAGTNDTVLAAKQNGPNCVAIDSTSVYWINAGGGMISKTGK